MNARRAPVTRIAAAVVAGTALVACQAGDGGADGGAAADAGPNVVDVEARDFGFDEIPSEIPSGWTTFRFTNTGDQEHFMYVYRLPDDVDYGQFRTRAMRPFSEVWDAYSSGEIDREEAGKRLGAEMPEWFFTGITAAGGPALTEPGETATTTVRLEPGTHVIECYVKTPAGTYHTSRGMQQELTVTEESVGGSPPEADVELTLSNYAIEVSDSLTAGSHTVAVHVTEAPEGFMGHDVNLVRLDEETALDSVVAWMDWMDLGQFRAPAPGHSLGGVDQLAAGRTGYLTVELTPGRYAWVSENYADRGMVREFTIE